MWMTPNMVYGMIARRLLELGFFVAPGVLATVLALLVPPLGFPLGIAVGLGAVPWGIWVHRKLWPGAC